MPYRSKKSRRLRRFRRAHRSRKISRNRFGHPTYSYKYTTLLQNWLPVTMNGNDMFFAKTFIFSDVPSFNDLKALYDLYRINKVGIKLIPRYNSNLVFIQSPREDGGANTDLNTDAGGTNLGSGSNWGLPELISVIDFDDDTVFSTVSEAYEYNTLKRSLCTKEHKRFFVPRIKIDASNVGLSMSRRWLDCDNAGVKHYGIKGCVTNVPLFPGPGSAEFRIDLEVTYYIQFANTR